MSGSPGVDLLFLLSATTPLSGPVSWHPGLLAFVLGHLSGVVLAEGFGSPIRYRTALYQHHRRRSSTCVPGSKASRSQQTDRPQRRLSETALSL